MYKDYCLPLELYIRLKKSLNQYTNHNNQQDITKFVEDLPHKLKIEISIYIYEEKYKKIKMFKTMKANFITWVCPLLKPLFLEEKEYVYLEGDSVTQTFFLVKGKTSFILPSFDNISYINMD